MLEKEKEGRVFQMTSVPLSKNRKNANAFNSMGTSCY